MYLILKLNFMTSQSNKGMNIGLWISQSILAAIFLISGLMKTTQPIEKLSTMLPWAKDLPFLVRFIGIAELFGAIGLILPSLLRIKPNLTVWAAIGLVLVMFLATCFHMMQGEFKQIGLTLFLLIVSAFVAWGRSKNAVIQAK